MRYKEFTKGLEISGEAVLCHTQNKNFPCSNWSFSPPNHCLCSSTIHFCLDMAIGFFVCLVFFKYVFFCSGKLCVALQLFNILSVIQLRKQQLHLGIIQFPFYPHIFANKCQWLARLSCILFAYNLLSSKYNIDVQHSKEHAWVKSGWKDNITNSKH